MGGLTHPCFIYFCGSFLKTTLKKCCEGVLCLVKKAVRVFGVKANAATPLLFFFVAVLWLEPTHETHSL